ncbi:MAG: hypothetical protein JTT11_04650 [Candidatus Brockarchaeota archaeon]|nr:hypothetical protein [Candidatus Brockarchaeota archaeon]
MRAKASTARRNGQPLRFAIFAALLALAASFLAPKVPNMTLDEFQEFDRKGNLIHVFSEDVFGTRGERDAVVLEGEAVTWGWEWFDASKERVEDILDGSTVSLEVDGVQIVPEGGKGCWSEILFFPGGVDHDGDGLGDGDGDGIGDIPGGFVAAFRFTAVLGRGVHVWEFRFADRTGLVELRDSGLVTVLANRSAGRREDLEKGIKQAAALAKAEDGP